MLTERQVQIRGWSPKMIKDILKAPDAFDDRNKPLYSPDRVTLAEAGAPYKQAFSVYRDQMQRAARRLKDAENSTVAEAHEIPLQIVQLPLSELKARAQSQFGEAGLVAQTNYLLYASFPFAAEKVLQDQPGAFQANQALKWKIISHIPSVYPHLTNTCQTLKKKFES